MKFSLAVLGLALAATATAQPTFLHPDRVRYDGHCFTIDGKDTFIFSGAFHYFRCPKELWRARFKKIKEAGFNAVETYAAWNWSEQTRPSGLNDTSHIQLGDLDEWLKMAEDEFGLYTIVRPGPYICSEWATGGFPNWLQTFKPANPKRRVWYRSDDPVFEDWSNRWFKAVAKVVDKHQLTHKPKGAHGVILWQVENEYDFSGDSEEIKANYLRDLIVCSQKAGIDVPIFTCWTSPTRHPNGDPILSQAFDNPNEYPRWSIEDSVAGINDQQASQPYAPKMVTEFQGGWFGGVGGKAAEEQDGINDAQINALTLWSIGNGMTGLNYYMLFGGTNFGDWAAQGITTSYDYYAPVNEWGGGGPKYRAVKAIGKMLQEYGGDLARSDEPPFDAGGTEGSLHRFIRKGKSGATYLFFWNESRTEVANVDAGDGKNLILPAFGANVFRYTSKPSDGKWIVNAEAVPKSETLPTIRLKSAEVCDLTPSGWRGAPKVPTTTNLGVWDSRFVAYRSAVPKGKFLWLRSQDSELVGNTPAALTGVQGGDVWPGSGQNADFILFNPGWPNGGNDMELPHGITAAQIFDKVPDSASVSDWKTKMLTDQTDRSLTAEGVDTSSWTDGVHNDLFAPHTTGVVRAVVDLPAAPKPDAVLDCGGVDDEGWFYVNGHLVGEIHAYNVPVQFKVAQYLHQGKNDIAIVIQNDDGEGGLTGKVTIEQPLGVGTPPPMQWTDRFSTSPSLMWALDPTMPLSLFEHPKVEGNRPVDSAKLVKTTLKFDAPDSKYSWKILLEGGGDGFLTLNGHPLGRYWEVGPQRAFYLPSPWLKAHNVLEVTVVPGRFGDRVKAAELRALPWDE